MHSFNKAIVKRRICIVAHAAYGALSGGIRGHIGGVERQTTLTARWLAQQGYSVSLVTWDEGQPADQIIDGVRVIKLCRQDAGWPGVRFLHPRWSSLIQALGKANADVYYQNCAEYVTGQVALWCKLHHRRFVYSVASDPDCDPDLPKMRSSRERVLYRFGLRNAATVIVQTRAQQEMLRQGFGVQSEILAMPCPGPDMPNVPSLEERRPRSVLWIGRVAPVKQLEVLLDIAAAAPDLSFEVIGPLDDSPYVRSLVERAEKLSNVRLQGAVHRVDMPGCYAGGAVLCCTSAYEGFPNTFLEAWSHGVPVVSTVDPDGLITRFGLGRVGHTPNELLAALRSLLEDPVLWREASSNARSYFLETHDAKKVFPLFEKILLGLSSVVEKPMELPE